MTKISGRSILTSNLRGWMPRFGNAHHTPLFDVFTMTAHDLQGELIAGRLESTQLLEEYYRTICAHNGYLNAVFVLAPGAMKRAQEMDTRRAKGEFLGPLHGIPILIKDNISTDPSMGMGTTAGALPLDGSEPMWNTRVVDLLNDAGAIIIGKTTLSEMAGRKGIGLHDGWSSIAGQCQSAYVQGGLDPTDGTRGHSSPAGSSAGSAVAVSAGMAPVAIGTETNGSLSAPALRASLYSLKPTLGLIPGEGIVPVSYRFDIAGPVAKNTRDVANLLSALVDFRSVPKGGYASVVGDTESWKEIRVGTLDPEKWEYPDFMVRPVPRATDEIVRKTRAAYASIKALAKSYHENVSLRPVEDFDIDGENSVSEALITDFESDLDRFLGTVRNSKVSTLREMVAYNPSQALLERSLSVGNDAKRRAMLLDHMKAVSESLEDTLNKYDIDMIIGPGDCFLSQCSAALGCPLATVPLSYLDYNGRPVGLILIARPYQEALLLKMMGAFEATFPATKPPTAFLDVHKR